MCELELHVDENKSKKETGEKKFFLKFNLKVVETKCYELKWLTMLNYTSCRSN